MERIRTALFDYVTQREDHSKGCRGEEGIVEQFVRSVLDFSSQYGSDISVSYSALNLSGKPSNFPDYGDFPQSLVTLECIWVRYEKSQMAMCLHMNICSEPPTVERGPSAALNKFHKKRTYGKWWQEAPSAPVDYHPINNGNIPSSDFVEIMFQKEVYPTGIRIYETYNPGAVVRIWAMGRHGWVKLWEGEPEMVDHSARLFRPPIRNVDFPTCILKLEFNQLYLDDYTQLDAVLLEGTSTYIGNDNNASDNLSESASHQSSLLKTDDLTSFIMSLGLHNDLITEWKNDFLKVNSNNAPIMGDFHTLPDETITKIFSYLDLKSLCRCAQVNKCFNRLALDPLLYKSINLKPYWYCVDESVLYTLSKRASLLQKIDLSWCGCDRIPSYDCFAQLMKNCGHTLTHLRLNSCRFVDNFILSCITDNCANLRELSLNSCRNIIPTGFIFLLRLKHLTRLDLYRTRIEAHFLLCVVRQNKGLQHLNLGSCVYLTSMDEIAEEIGTNCKDLISIDLWKNYSLTPNGIKALAKCSKLQEVDFGWCLQACSSGEWISELAQSCPNLRKIFIGALRSITDRDLRPLAKYCPNLEQLDMFGSAITGDVCELLLANCTRLRLMDINFCEQISDSQVKVWRQNYPSVVIKRSCTTS